MTLDELINEGENLLNQQAEGYFGKTVPKGPYEIWKRTSLLFLQKTFPNHPQNNTFELYVS